MMNKSATNEKEILLDNLRICRIILEYKQDAECLEMCRKAIKENIDNYDEMVRAKEEAAQRNKNIKRNSR
ncbi:MAG: hypothetical protein RR956_05875 [Christensenella sp.]